MKKLLNIVLLGSAIAVLPSCKKEALDLNPDANAAVAFIHASPGSPAVNVLIDNQVIIVNTNAARTISYGTVSAGGGGGTGGAYTTVLSGAREVKVSPDSGRNNVVSTSLTFAANKAYTVAVYDTLPVSGTAALRAVQLTDDLTPPTGTNVHVRFLHLAPLAPAVDLTLVRGANVDSVTLSNRTYLGATPNATALSAFAPIAGGTAYTLRVKLAGTQTVVAIFNLGATLTSGRIVTLAAIGTARGQGLNAMALRHL